VYLVRLGIGAGAKNYSIGSIVLTHFHFSEVGNLPKAEQLNDSITLYECDCLEVLPTLTAGSVDAVVTSPPYNTLPQANKVSGLHAERRTGVNKWVEKAANGYFDSMPEADYQQWLRCVLTECVRVCAGIVWVNHKIRYRDGEAIHPARMFDWPIYSEVIWDRGISMALNCKRYAPSTEHLIGFGRPVVWNDELNSLMSVWRMQHDRDDNDHPCAFPIELAMRPIRSSTAEGSTVLDCFGGSGTTAIAAMKTGRKCILIEKDAKYCDVIRRRVEKYECKQPGSIFREELALC